MSMKKLSHMPSKSPRDPYQQAFSEEWKEMLDADDRVLGNEILVSLRDEIDEDVDVLAADIARWWGSIVGLGFIDMGVEMSRTLTSRQDAFVAAWAVKNSRRAGMNQGARLLEVIAGDWENPKQDLTTKDYEVADLMAAWLGSGQGAKFIGRCMKKGALLEEVEKLSHHSEGWVQGQRKIV